MCLIVAKNSKVNLPPIKYLKNANFYNPHGIGIAYWKYGSGEVIIKKDFKNIKPFIKWFKKNISKKDACIIHFRFATSGLVDNGNRHPFPLTKNGSIIRRQNFKCKIAVAHNGIVSQYSPCRVSEKNKNFSDTQLFIMDILQEPLIKENLENKTIKKLLGDFVGGDRLAFINAKGHIEKIGEFEKNGGIYYSNDKYKQKIIRESVQESGNTEKNRVRVWGISSGYMFESKCEGCGKLKLVSYEQVGVNSALLCKDCIKKYEQSYEITNDKNTIQCDSCGAEFSKKEIGRYGDEWLCESCIFRLQNYDL